MALVATLMVMGIVTVLGVAIVLNTATDLNVSTNERAQAYAFYEADAGLERTKVDLSADNVWVEAAIDKSMNPLGLADPFPTSLTINGTTVALTTEGGEAAAGYYRYGGSVTLDDGSFVRDIWLPPIEVASANATGSKVWVTVPTRSTGSTGGAEPSTQIVRADTVALVTRVLVWDNAVFAGSGQSGNIINGNVEIHGSMHVIGDTDTPGHLDFSGGAGVYNNYADVDDSQQFGGLAVKLPSLPTRTIGGQSVATLDAEVRVKDADIELDGGASLGLPDDGSNSTKETLDGFWVDGDVTIDGSSGVYADGQGDYDINEQVFYPSLDDAFVDEGGTYWTTHREYLNARGLTLPVNEISDQTAAFSYSDGFGNSIDWDPDTGVLQVEGVVRVDGDLRFGRSGPTGTISYAGTGTIYATQDIDIAWDVVPQGDYIGESDPSPDNLGLIADRAIDMGVGGGSTHLKIMAAIYGEEEVEIAKQSTIAGAVVADYFDMGQNVPSIYQVPRLANHLPPAMPGAEPILAVTATETRNWYHER